MTTQLTFASFYSAAQFTALLDHHEATPKNDQGEIDWDSPEYESWSVTYRTHCDVIGTSLCRFLKEMAARGSIQAISDELMFRRSHRMMQAWNALAAGKADEHQMARLAKSIQYALLTCGLYEYATLPRLDAHKGIVGSVDAGTFEWFKTDSRETCETTGDEVVVEFHGWAARPGTIDYEVRPIKGKPLQPIPSPAVAHHVIPVPSGELLIMDWPRIDAFTEAVSEDHHYSIGNDDSRVRKTAWYASQGFASVFVGNTLPKVVVRNGHLIIARIDEDDGDLPPCEGEFAGRVCTDLWWATAIDREVLVATLAKSMPQEAAETAVATWLKETGSDVTTVKVIPGNLHVYHTGRESDMQDFRSADVPDGRVEQLYAVLSQRELNWAPKVPLAATEDRAMQPRKFRP